MRGLAIDTLCVEFRILDPYDSCEYRIFQLKDSEPGYRWQLQWRAPGFIEPATWSHITETPEKFDDIEEAYCALDDYMQSRWKTEEVF